MKLLSSSKAKRNPVDETTGNQNYFANEINETLKAIVVELMKQYLL